MNHLEIDSVEIYKCLDCSAIYFKEALGKINIPKQRELFCKGCGSRNIVKIEHSEEKC